MSWWRGYAGPMAANVDLGRETWYRIGGRARYVARPRSVEELATLVRRAAENEVPVKALGRGANVLLRDAGFDGVVVRLDEPDFRRVRRSRAVFQIGAGVDLMTITRQLSRDGWSGLESLAGIPASIGGAIRMNAGGLCGVIGDVVRTVTVVTPDGVVDERSRGDVGFEYRGTALGGCIVVSATLQLERGDPRLVGGAYDANFARKLATQPMNENSAGCVFKNPEGTSAGALIDRVGLKGRSVGGASVSQRHANFIVTRSGACATDVTRLMDIVQSRVQEETGYTLEPEIDVW